MSDEGSVVDNERVHRFEIARGNDIAFLTYRLDGNVLVLVHTEVPHAMEGHGAAAALAKGAFESARSRELRVGVICPFVAKWLERHPQQQDIVAFIRTAKSSSSDR